MAWAWRLRRHADYQAAYARSRRGSTRQISYFFAVREAAGAAVGETAGQGARAPVDGPRVGLTVPKAVGKAHERNRIKRRMREIVRGEIARLEAAGVDVILHPRRSAMEGEFGGLRREVVEIFARVRRAMAEPEAGDRGRPVDGRGRRGTARPKGGGGR